MNSTPSTPQAGTVAQAGTDQESPLDFLTPPKKAQEPEMRVSVENAAQSGEVVVTLEREDGRVLRRKVPVDSFREDNYRTSLIKGMAMLLA